MFERILASWTDLVIHNHKLTLLLLAVLTGMLGTFAVIKFKINSDTSKLIVQDTDWRKVHDEFIDQFPQYDKTTFIVVSGSAPNKVKLVAEDLARDLKTEDEFKSVFSPASSEYYDKNIFLYMQPRDLEKTIQKLANAQPFLSAIAADNSIRSVLMLLISAMESEENIGAGLSQVSEALRLARDKALDPDFTPISWRDQLFSPDGDQIFYQLIFIQGRQNFGLDLPNSVIVDSITKAVEDNNHPFKADVQIRLTGQVALEHGEIVNAMESAKLSGSIAVIILLFVLIWGIRSPQLIAAIYFSMFIGLIWTAAFAMSTVGQYNTISIIFLVMFIGLGVDFAVHLSLKYQELANKELRDTALTHASRSLGPALFLCGLTSAIGFLSFVPTPYRGLAEMGIISAGGMLIAVFVTLTFIPAFFSMTKKPNKNKSLFLANFLTRLHQQRSKEIAYVTIVIIIISGLSAGRAEFDYSTLSLKNPNSEAMSTLKELQDNGLVTDYTLFYIADSAAEAERKKQELLNLSVVEQALVPEDYLPKNQSENLEILEEASFLLSSIFLSETKQEPFKDSEYLELLENLGSVAENRLTKTSPNSTERIFIKDIVDVAQSLANANDDARIEFSKNIIPPLKSEINWLENALSAEGVTLEDLPLTQLRRLVSEENKVIVSATPSIDVVPVESLRHFTESVLSIADKFTGRPVLDLGIGDIVVKSFWTAIFLACSGIFLILLFTLKSITDSVLVFIPLLITAFVTLAVSWIIDLPLNMANVVVIPLIFGLGVANGIHIVKRFHQTNSAEELINSSTPKAVFLSNLTTLASFGALCFSSHLGIYSIGVLLTTGIVALMVFTIVCLPALLFTFSSRRSPTRIETS